MSLLFPTFHKTLLQECRVARGGGMLIGVSGGIDSMVLLALAVRAAAKLELRLAVAHVNHQLRGKASNDDEAFVRRQAKGYGLGCYVERYRPNRSENLQEEARQYRIDFFERTCRELQLYSVATAHHQNDQAESILLHLIRGTGLSGLVGMSICEEREGGVLHIRPLLKVLRTSLEQYAEERDIPFRHDASNDSLRYRRNAIRHELLPVFNKMNTRAVEAIASMGSRLADDETALQLIAIDFLNEVTLCAGEDEHLLARVAYTGCPKAIRVRILKHVFERLTRGKHCLNSDQIFRLDALALRQDGRRARYQLPGDCSFLRFRDQLCISRARR